MNPVETILGRLDGVIGSAGKYRAKCPAHQGHSLTLSIKERQDGKAQVTCFKGCTADEITAIWVRVMKTQPLTLARF